MGVPVILLGESLVDNIVEVLVMGEDDVATDIVELLSGAQWLATLDVKWHWDGGVDLRNPQE